MQIREPRFNIKHSKYKEFRGKKDLDWFHTKYPINPYNVSTEKAKLFRKKQVNKIPWSKLVEELEPYSLYPVEEIKKLLKLYSFFILYYVNKGHLIDIPYLGQFCGASEEYEKPWKSKYKAFEDVVNIRHDTLKFRAAPFVNWYFNPNIYTPYRYQAVPGYFRAFDKFKKELIHSSGIDWYELFPDKRYLEFSLERLKCNGVINQYAGMPWVRGRKDPSKATLVGKFNIKRQPKKIIDTYAQD